MSIIYIVNYQNKYYFRLLSAESRYYLMYIFDVVINILYVTENVNSLMSQMWFLKFNIHVISKIQYSLP